MRQQPFASPGEALAHYGVKGMKWGERHDYEAVGRATAKRVTTAKPLRPGTPEFNDMVGRLTRTDRPQVLMPGTINAPRIARGPSGKVGSSQTTGPEQHGMTRNQKLLLAFGAATAAGAGYYAYKHYVGGTMPGLDAGRIAQQEKTLAGMHLPAHWDVKGLKNGPISKSQLGNLAGTEYNAKLLHSEKLVINTTRGYADILPKGGFSNPFAAEQHASVTKVLEEMREKFPAIRNMNIEVVPMSHVPGMEDGNSAHMAVMAMRAGEARVMYNDMIPKPDAQTIKDNLEFLPGLGAKDYVANHEMGHLLAVAHGELPPAFDILVGKAGPSAVDTWVKAEPLLHKEMFAKHGFTFQELSRLSQYAATEPAEAMAELAGHYFTPEMRSRLTADQIKRAGAMFNEMGGLTG